MRLGEPMGDPSERFDLLAGAVTDYAIFMLDLHGRVRSWNTGARRITGYEAEEIVGRHVSILYLADDLAGKPERALEMATREGRYEEEGWRVRRDGSHYWANVIVTPLRDQAGQLLGYVEVSRDLTERRSADERQHRLRLLEERYAIAGRLQIDVLGALFGVGIALQSAASHAAPDLARQLELAIVQLDEVVAALRRDIFGLSRPV